MIPERQQLILEAIIKEYVKTAQPVSSGVLATKYHLSLSPATVRNEMMELEEAGYIYQPHTSAGRVPTEAAYNLGVEKLLKNRKRNLTPAQEKLLEQALSSGEGNLKATAKVVAELSGHAVFWAFHKNDLYYTGISNLFSQAEFRRLDLISDVSGVIDRMEEIIDALFDDLPFGPAVLIGSANPFGNFLSAILLKYKQNNRTGVMGILGPLRLDYERQLALVEYLADKLAK